MHDLARMHRAVPILRKKVNDPRYDAVRDWWLRYGLASTTIGQYSCWVGAFLSHCRRRRLVSDKQLTRIAVSRFARVRAHNCALNERWTIQGARIALHAWARGLAAIGYPVPAWVPAPTQGPFAELIEEYVSFRRRRRGITERTAYLERLWVARFLSALKRRRRRLSTVRMSDVDRFVAETSARCARTTTKGLCGVIRSFLRFLHLTERLPEDLSPAVLSPRVRKSERPYRVMPWADVQRILRAVDRSTALGSRDFALLLLMASYGLRVGEALQLRLEDIDWKAGTIHVFRSKTGVETWLPLSPAVGHAMATYLRRGRTRRTVAREIFLRSRAPHCRLRFASAVCHILRKHAAIAGISAPFLGSHVLRHSHATRQIEEGALPKVVGDILGHASPNSTSAYVRLATKRLRRLALPVPR